MKEGAISEVERSLVLRYLLDDNVPVTVTPVLHKDEYEDESLHTLNSQVYPVALKSENISVLKEGIILLKNNQKNICDFIDKTVKVEFYFNHIGLYFTTVMKTVRDSVALVIPDEIFRIKDVEIKEVYEVEASLSYSKDTQNLTMVPKSLPLFVKPAWSIIPLDCQSAAKSYLERYSKILSRKNPKDTTYLINICFYMVTEEPFKIEAVEGRVKNLDILFLDHSHMVVGYEKNPVYNLEVGKNYDLNISFMYKDNPLIKRNINVSGEVKEVFDDEELSRICVDLEFTNLKEEDVRFLYEKATSLLLI